MNEYPPILDAGAATLASEISFKKIICERESSLPAVHSSNALQQLELGLKPGGTKKSVHVSHIGNSDSSA